MIMWIICCRKQETKKNKTKDNLQLSSKYSISYNDHRINDNQDNCKLKNDLNIHTKLSHDSYANIENGHYPKQERRSLPDVVIPSTNLPIPRSSLQIDYETGRRSTIYLETTVKLAESESINLDDNYSSNIFNETFLNNIKLNMANRDFLLDKPRAHSLISSTYQKQLTNNHKGRQGRKSDVSRSDNHEKKLISKKRLSLFKVKPLKRFRKSKDSLHSLSPQKCTIRNDKSNMISTMTCDRSTNSKTKSSLKRIKPSKLFSTNKSSHENIGITKDLNNHESCSERSEDSLGQLPMTRNSMFKHIQTRTTNLYQTTKNFDLNKQNYLNNIEHSMTNSKNTVLRRGSLCIFSQIDEPIVTPFAQILASLRKVRFNFILLTNVTSTRDSRFGAVQPIQSTEDGNSSSHLGCSGGQNKITASETLEELEWCLERLENIQTHRSVSDMASSKFKKMLNKELSQFADAGQSGKQISEYICSTFLDSKENDPLTTTSHSSVISHNNTHGIMSNSINKDIMINNHDNPSEMNTCTPSDSIKNSESTGMYLFKSVEPGEIIQTTTTTTTLTDNIDGDTTIGVTGDSSSSNIPHTINSTTVTIGSTTMNKSLSKLSSSLSTLSLKMNSNVNVNENTNNNNNNNDDNNINIMMKSSGNSHTTMSIPPSGTSPLSHQHHSECDKIHCSQTQIVPYIINSTNPKKLEDLLKTSLDLWGIDIFEVDQLTTNPLTCIFYNIVQKRNLLQKFAIPERNLLLYMTAVEEKYNNNPYHNRVHAADVVQSTHVLLNAQSLESVFTDLEIFTVLFACAIHDVGHPGVTNQYLINTNDQLAILYNDSSVLENHHLAIAFSLLGQPGHDVFENFPRKQRLSSRRMIIDMVLATDMSKHMSLLADLKTMVETKKVAGSGILTLENYIDRMQILQNMVHCADLSNPAKPLDLYRQWTNRVMEELFQQGDKERELGIEISPICDRNTATIEKSQVSFIDYIVHPLWETWSDLVYPDAQTILETLEDNREWYYNQINENNNDNNAENDE
uniref:Phosphodiesterase n=1 Tax=Schistosoma mansoni TaxID=6183 RepID=A0A3Q0KNG7_SCHMA|nr:phosphodiesterase Sm4B [Schistosoma mansoni]